MVPPKSGWGWQTTAAIRGSPSSGSSSNASRRPAGPARLSDSMRRGTSIRAVVDELQVDAEIGVAQQLDGRLQGVAVLAGYAHEIALDGGLHLQLAVLDLLDQLAGLLDGDSLLHGDLLLDRGSGRGDDLTVSQALQRDLAFDQFGLQDVHHRLDLKLVLAVQQDFVVLLVELDVGMRVLELSLIH